MGWRGNTLEINLERSNWLECLSCLVLFSPADRKLDIKKTSYKKVSLMIANRHCMKYNKDDDVFCVKYYEVHE